MMFEHIYISQLLMLNVLIVAGYSIQCHSTAATSLRCKNYVPTNLPKGTTSVEIIDMLEHISEPSFKGHGWTEVKRLSVTSATHEVNDSLFPLHNDTFRNVRNLKYLRLNFPKLSDIEENAFKGLDNLSELDVSGCRRLSIYYIILILGRREMIPNLQVLKIDELNMYKYGPMHITSFDEKFFRVLSKRNISELVARHMFIQLLDLESFARLVCNNIKTVDLSNTIVSKIVVTPIICKSLEVLIMNGIKFSYTLDSPQYENGAFDYNLGVISNFYKNIKKLKVDSIYTARPWILRNMTLNISSYTAFSIKEFSFQNNMFQYVDITVHADAFEMIEKLELQRNGIRFLKGEFFQISPVLNTINISHNQLGFMQLYNSSDFVKLFEHVQQLRILDLSDNDLTHMPRNIFYRNFKLEKLYLVNNKLTQFSPTGRLCLKYLDLQTNTISQLNEESRQWFNDIFTEHQNRTAFHVDLHGNPFQCTCLALEFLHWFTKSAMYQNMSCDGKDNGDAITPELVKSIKETCDRPEKLKRIIIVLSVAIVSTTLMTVFIFKICRYQRKRHKLRRTIDEIITQIQNGEYRFEFPVFLSYSNDDADFVMENIYHSLVAQLTDILNVQRDIVCTGDKHFRPGRRIYDEIFRCLENSAVFVAVVSYNFCNSVYCRNEIEEAYAMGKQIFIMYTAEIDEEAMTPLLRELFKKYTRIKVCFVNGEIFFEPSLETICQSIIESLA